MLQRDHAWRKQLTSHNNRTCIKEVRKSLIYLLRFGRICEVRFANYMSAIFETETDKSFTGSSNGWVLMFAMCYFTTRSLHGTIRQDDKSLENTMHIGLSCNTWTANGTRIFRDVEGLLRTCFLHKWITMQRRGNDELLMIAKIITHYCGSFVFCLWGGTARINLETRGD